MMSIISSSVKGYLGLDYKIDPFDSDWFLTQCYSTHHNFDVLRQVFGAPHEEIGERSLQTKQKKISANQLQGKVRLAPEFYFAGDSALTPA